MNPRNVPFFLMALVACSAEPGSPEGQPNTGPNGTAEEVDAKEPHYFPTVPNVNSGEAKAQPSGGEDLGVVSQALNSGHGIAYNGGHVMSGTVHVYLIWYGNWAGNSAVNILSDLIPGLSFSPYYFINTLYDDDFGGRVSGAVTLAGSTFNSYSHGLALTKTNIKYIVSGAIDSGELPLDANGVYLVLTSSDVTQSNSSTYKFCDGYCGWHTDTTLFDTNIKYSFVGDGSACPTTCPTPTPSPNGNPGADEMANVLAHELEETVTDPNINAWRDPGDAGENADKCAWDFGTTYTTSNGAKANMKLGTRDYRIQKNWLNSGAGSCALSYGAGFKNAICGRHSSGITCARSTGTSFSTATVWQSEFSDAAGWNGGPQYYDTIRYPDVSGDGQADVCGRGVSGIKCALSNNTSFGALSIWQSSFSDTDGWNVSKYYSTIQFADVNGDGRSDVCGRASSGIKCALSSGSGFGALSTWQSSFSDAQGWASASHYLTIQFADINGDGKADVCGRGDSGMKCALSTGTSFGSLSIWDATFNTDADWDGAQYYSTIRLVDVNGDALADVCGRGASGIKCGLSSGSSFSAATVWQPAASAFSDAGGWNSWQYYSTIQFADLNADGMADVCGRAASGMKCALSTGSAFGVASIWQSTFSDAGGWNSAPYYSTIKLADLNRDGRADICGHAASGMKCALSTGTSFGTASIWESWFSDGNGWNGAAYNPTIGFAPQH